MRYAITQITTRTIEVSADSALEALAIARNSFRHRIDVEGPYSITPIHDYGMVAKASREEPVPERPRDA